MANEKRTREPLEGHQGSIVPDDQRAGENDTTGDDIAANFLGTMNYRKLGMLGEYVKDNSKSGGKDPLPLCQIRGEVAGVTKKGDNTNGEPSWALVGEFEGTNLQTGEIFYSGQLFLPGGVHDMLANSFLNADANDQPSPIMFALEILSIRAANKAGYSLVCKSLIPAKRSPVLQRIRAMEAKFKALPKPTAA